MDSTEAVTALVSYLRRPVDKYNRLGASVLEDRTRKHIDKIVDGLAVEILNELPGLKSQLRQMIAEVVTKTLNDDTYLSRAVTESVARALAQVRNERENGSEDG